MSASYAALKGRPPPPDKAPDTPTKKVEISEAEKARVEANKLFVIEHMPELIPVIREMHAHGLIDGWRSIKTCTLNQENP